MSGNSININSSIPIYVAKVRLTPTDFSQLNSAPVTIVSGINGFACLFITGSAIKYIGNTPYNEGSNLFIVDSVNFNQQGQTAVITNTGRNAIITQQQTSDCLSSGNGLVILMGNDLTGGDYGYDINILYQKIPIV